MAVCSLDHLIARLAFRFEEQRLAQVILMEAGQPQCSSAVNSTSAHSSPVFDWFNRYAQGSQDFFDSQLLVRHCVSAFRQKVWDQVSLIAFGETRSYADIALAIGSPRATRAVGSAIGCNPCMIARPCHRVVAARGKLGGFAFHLDIKKQLLRHEGVLY